jgi:hypothetical protein
MNILGQNINVIKQVFSHEPVIALQSVWLHRPVFIEIKCDDMFERELFFGMEPNEFVVNSDWGTTGCKTEHSFLVFARPSTNKRSYFTSDCSVGVSGLVVYGDGYSLNG